MLFFVRFYGFMFFVFGHPSYFAPFDSKTISMVLWFYFLVFGHGLKMNTAATVNVVTPVILIRTSESIKSHYGVIRLIAGSQFKVSLYLLRYIYTFTTCDWRLFDIISISNNRCCQYHILTSLNKICGSEHS